MRAAHAVWGGVVLSLMVPLGMTAAPAVGAPEAAHKVHATADHKADHKADRQSSKGNKGNKGGDGDGDKKAWVPKRGAAYSNPLSPRHRILVAKVIRAVNASKKGSKIQIAVWNLDDWPSVGALIAGQEARRDRAGRGRRHRAEPELPAPPDGTEPQPQGQQLRQEVQRRVPQQGEDHALEVLPVQQGAPRGERQHVRVLEHDHAGGQPAVERPGDLVEPEALQLPREDLPGVPPRTRP